MRHPPARAPLQGLTRRPAFRAIARALVVFLLVQSIPTDGLRVGRAARAHAGDVVLWVDAQGSCAGEVPCHRTIQSAIDAVQAGQTVRILPGEYVEQLIVKQRNVASRGEADRIVIEADPRAPADSVVLRGTRNRCEAGHAVDFDRSRDVTLRGLTIAGAGARGVVLRGGSRQNAGIRLERNRIFRGATRECSGGIDVGRGNPDTAIVNNLIYANGRHGVRFRDGRGGSYVVAGNTIVGNGWSGVSLTRSSRATLVNNLIAFNGTAPGRSAGRHGVWRQRSATASPDGVTLLDNLICGNRLGELSGPLLDAADGGNQTPTGGEGAGVVASPGCASESALFAHRAGDDGTPDTADDDFALAPASPARDRGRDPRGALGLPDAILLADFLAAGARPRDGDGDDVAAFDVGALEAAGAGATPTPSASPTPETPPTASASPTPSVVPPTATPTPSRTPLPTRSPTPAPTPTATPSPTRNGAPVAVEDEYAVRPGETLSVPAAGVLANDDDPDGDALTASLVDPPVIGTLSQFDPDGSFAYAPPAQFVQPSLNPVARLRVVHGLDGHGQVADTDRDGHPDIVYPEFGAMRALDGETGTRLWDYDPSDTTDVNASGCSLVTFSTTLALGDLTGGGDVSLVHAAACDGGVADRFVAINTSQVTAGKVRATWLSDRLTQPHPAAYLNTSATAPAVPPLRPSFSGSFAAEPSLARLEASGGVKLLSRRLIGPSQGQYLTRNAAGVFESRFAGCRSVTGLPADEGRQCRATWIVDASNGAVEGVLTAPNASGEQDTTFWRPWRNNAPIVADLDGDGAVEIVSGSDVFERVGGVWQLAWQTPFEPASVAVADLDGDGTAEIVQHQHSGSPRTPADVGIFIYRHDGTLLRRIPPKATGEASFGFVSIGDADGDGAPEILYTVDGVLYVYRADGRLLWLFLIPDRPQTLNGLVPGAVALFGRSGETAPQVYDLDLDGRPEVILNAAARLYIFDGPTGAETWSIDTEGGPFGPKTLALADFDADGHVDILAMTSNRWNCSVVTGGPVPCLGNTLLVSGQDLNWAPGPKVFNQLHYRANAVDDAATILFAPANRRDFRRAAQQGTVTDPRLRQGATFTYRASDGSATSNPATVYVKINPDNSPPTITSLPPTGFLSVTPYTRPVYQITATDPDPGDVVHYELVSTTHPFGVGPGAGVNLNPTTGAVDFYTGPCGSFGGGCIFNGDILVVVAAIDSLGARDEQSILLTIYPFPTAVPNVVGMLLQPAIDALVASSLRARVLLEIFDPAPAGTVLQQSPAGGAPNVAVGTSVELTLSKGPEPTPTPTPSPTPDPNATPTPVPTAGPPLASIVVEPTTPIVLAGETQAFTATGVFEDGTSADLTSQVTWQSSVVASATIGASGVASAIAAGSTTISAMIEGVTGSTELTVVARVPSDFVEPTAAITSPVDGAEVTEPIDVIGTASDANFLEYELAIALAGESDFTVIASGAAPVANGVLGRLDPTLLINDLYDLKLTVHDRGGNRTEAMIGVQVARNLKIGLFTLGYKDLELDLAGIPLTVNRIYDSRFKAKGDFGIGWRLDVQTLHVRRNREQGSAWYVNQVGGALGAFVLSPTAEHKVSITLPDGRIEEFDLFITPSVSPLVPLQTVTASYVPRAGTIGRLAAIADNDLLVVGSQPGEVTLLGFSGVDVYDPMAFRYTAADGRVIDIHRKNGVERVQDPNGNTLTFGANGIVHSSGASVAFARDAQGRITQITEPSGDVQTYEYDGRGDLVRHSDAAGNGTRFTYDRLHGLLGIVDPTGGRAVRNEYDDAGRLVATVDAEGHRVEFSHDLAARQEVVTDRLGNASVLEYDANGNIVRRIDVLGGITTYTYDANDNRLSETDPLGRTATKTFDQARNVLTDTDFDGNTTTQTYNALQQVLTSVDATGATTSNTYDLKGNLIESRDARGGVSRFTYDAAGNQLTATDPLGRTTAATYDGLGREISRTAPASGVTTFTYDANGRRLTETDAAGHTTRFTYDGLGQVIETEDAIGGTTRATFDANGRKVTETDQLGRVTAYRYDVRGNLVETTYPDGSTETTTYDAASRPVTRTDRRGFTTSYTHDALDRMTRTTHPDGAIRSATYDAVGRVLTETDERGYVTTTSYTANERKVTDALGRSVVETFDGRGRRVGRTDELGRLLRFVYDPEGNLTQTIFPDGSMRSATYDLASQNITQVDQAGRITTHGFDAAGRLDRVVDATGAITAYGYDLVGNRITEMDANGHTTKLTYDPLRRLSTRERPMGEIESFAYDAKGNRTAHTDFNGDTTAFTYDTSDKLASKILPDGTVVPYAFCGCGLRTQAGGDTYAYDARGRMVSETKASGDVLTYAYDAAGNKISFTTPHGTTTYTYDPLNRLTAVVGPSGTTAYAYDVAGNLASTSYPNGVTTTYGYDVLDRPTQVTSTGPSGLLASYSYTLGATGNREHVVESGPATSGRSVTYGYDAVYRLTEERIDEPGSADDETITYVYDAVGNRLQIDRDGAPSTFTYDDNDRLLSTVTGGSTVTMTYDDNGNLVSRSAGSTLDRYAYDTQDRLLEHQHEVPTGTETSSFDYDADGMRIGKEVAGASTTYLLDKSSSLAQVVAESTAAGTASFEHGIDLISERRAGGGPAFYLYDGQGSTRFLTDAAGLPTDSYTYDAFGVLLEKAGNTPNEFLYAGETLDSSLGYYYLRARYYDPSLGRFITTDPLAGDASKPSSLHRYVYADSDPVNKADPSGEVGSYIALIVYGVLSALILHLYFTYEPAKRQVRKIGTNLFTLRTCPGAISAGVGLAAGGGSVVIGERAGSARKGSKYAMFFAGSGAGFSISFASNTDFTAKGLRRSEDFAGQGTFEALTAGVYGYGTGYTKYVLPEGSKVKTLPGKPSSSGADTSRGVSRVAGPVQLFLRSGSPSEKYWENGHLICNPPKL